MNKGLLFFLFTLLAAGAAGTWWYLNNGKTEEPKYLTATASYGELKQTVTATGQLNPVLNVQVGSQISGYIKELFADYNSPVTKDQVVARLDASTYRAILLQAEGELKNAKAVHQLARLTAERKQKLVADRTVPQAEVDTALAALSQAEAQVQIKEASVERAKVDLDRCTIYAPIDGIVISRAVDVGQTVAASMNAPVLFTIANDLRKMQIHANVAEGDVGTVEVGQNVDFTVDAYPYRTFHGKVMQIRNAPLSVQNVVSYDTVIDVNNDDLKLKPGMTANVSINIAEREWALKIPNAALRFRMPETAGKKKEPAHKPAPKATPAAPQHSDSAVAATQYQLQRAGSKATRTIYVLEEKSGNAIAVQIKAGIGDGVFTEVIEGLRENQKVITGRNQVAGSPAPATASPLGGGGMGGMRRF